MTARLETHSHTGYGHIAPKSEIGRVVLIGYAVLSIPLTSIFLIKIGAAVTKALQLIYNRGLCFYCHPSQGSVPEEALPLYARADRETYTTPLGRVFAFRCFGSITKVPPRQRCEVSYEMEKGIGFSYYFSESQVPLNQLISHDKNRRKTAMELRYPALDFTSKR